MAFVINGITIKNPSAFKVERYNVTTMERLSNATMVGDIVARKRKFYFTYNVLSAEDFGLILQAIWNTDNLFFPLEYEDRGMKQRAMVYVGSIPSELHYMSNRNTVWKNVAFNLIER